MDKRMNKIMDRVRKLLRMADDTSSPHEAAIAATRASKLMAKHNIASSAVRLEQGVSATDINPVHASRQFSRVPRWFAALIVPVAELHDCHARYVPGRPGKRVEFLGVDQDAQVCAYVFDYLIAQIDMLAQRYKDRFPGATRAALNDYRKGCAAGILEVLAKMKAEKEAAEREVTTGRELVVRKLDVIAENHNIKYKHRRTYHRDNEHRTRGQLAGRRVRIREGVGSDSTTERLA